ncbi:MAG: hypothetical protein H0X13_07690 [Ramlibacter sp.]|nr:hypothetical protein [Ramlibacter sp.]
MPPVDRSPLGDEMVSRLPERKFPQPKPGGELPAHGAGPDITSRPGLPDHPERMAADIEDEDADPVQDSGPGIADGAETRGGRKG